MKKERTTALEAMDMPDFLKKAQRRTDEVCGSDENRLAALFVRPRNGDETRRLGTPGAFANAADSAPGDQAGPAELFGQNAVLVLTDLRVLVLGHGTLTGRVKGLIGAIELGQISKMTLDAPPQGEKGGASLEISFADGTSVTVTPGSRRTAFVEAFEDATQRA